LFLDACIPEGTKVRVAFAAADDIDEDEVEVARTPPARMIELVLLHPRLSPPMPPERLVPADADYRPLHARETGRELPWLRPELGDVFLTYEAPIVAPPARYLWVFLELSGTTKLTPRVRSLRAEYPSHDYLRRLPRFFSRDEAAADFLRSYLAMFDGFVFELEAKAAAREILLDPYATPEEALPWLSSFMGLVLDERWPLAAKRRMIAECGKLFRFRGTKWSLERMIEIAIGTRPIMIEHFRLRGLGGAIVGAAEGALTSSVLGAGYRVGAAIGEPGTTFIQEDGDPAPDPFERYAHRFSVVIPGRLSNEQVDIVRFILDRHRPAHTIYDLCLVDAGMRLGVGLHVGLSSLVGRTGGFDSLTLGSNPLGRTILGRPERGISAGNDLVGLGTRIR
jgi:phage tail-like protein